MTRRQAKRIARAQRHRMGTPQAGAVVAGVYEAGPDYGVNTNNPDEWTRVVHSIDADRQAANRAGWNQKRIDKWIFEGAA